MPHKPHIMPVPHEGGLCRLEVALATKTKQLKTKLDSLDPGGVCVAT